MQPDSERFILLQDTQIYAVGLMVWHLLLNSTSSWIHMKRTGSRNKALILSRLLPQKRKRALDDGSILSWSSITAQSPSMDFRIIGIAADNVDLLKSGDVT